MFPQTINAMYQFYENEIGKQQSLGADSSQIIRADRQSDMQF